MGIFDCNIIDCIVLSRKTKYNAKIILKSSLKDEKNIIIMQLLLGSDYQKETNTILNHFKLSMKYSNRLFDVKKYRENKIKYAVFCDATTEIKNYVLGIERKKYKN